MISRSGVLQRLLGLYEQPRYLEIGVNRGVTFHAVTAHRKVAVDPKFVFAVPAGQSEGVSYHEVTSDEYFGRIVAAEERFDLIYLDGLHTFEQTLRDLINALAHLAPGGVVLIDDIIPNSFQASLPSPAAARAVRDFLGQTDPSWMGDVFKLVFFVQSFFQKLSYATIRDNHGQLVLWQASREKVVARDIGEFARLSFADVVLQKDAFQIRPLDEILAEIRP